MYLFFFWIFCFLTFSRIFQKVKKKVKIFVFFFPYNWNLRNVFELNFWHEKLISFDENVFLELLTDYCYDWKFFYFFEIHTCPYSGPIWKKKTENLKKCSTFEISFVALRTKFRPIGRKFHQKYSFVQNYYQKYLE
jgi:hypothetical protein